MCMPPLPLCPPMAIELSLLHYYTFVSLFHLDLDLDIFPYNNINQDTTIGTHKWSNGSLKVDRDIFYLTCLFALKLTISVSGHSDQLHIRSNRPLYDQDVHRSIFKADLIFVELLSVGDSMCA